MYAEKSGRSTRVAHQTHELLLRILREREPALGEHVEGVARMATEMAQILGVDPEGLDVVRRAAELHDIGKIAIPDEILTKPGPLDEREWDLMRRHTLIGERILGAAPALRPVAELVRASHERWDGQGYPDGRAGDDIPLGARIIFICDAFEAMTANRPYRSPPFTEKEAIDELRRHAGTQFDPSLVDLFVRLWAGARNGDPTANGTAPALVSDPGSPARS
jgi:two-component system, cell cycle response regulator